MKIYLTDQKENFDRLINQLTIKPTMTFDKMKLKEKTTTIDINSEKTLDQINLDFLFGYKIFPSNIMTYMTQWGKEKRKMKIGDTILQQVFILPTKTFSQKIIFGVRINSIIDETDRKGLVMRQLKGTWRKVNRLLQLRKVTADSFLKSKHFLSQGIS